MKPRDAGNTRQLLIEAARLRFARDGYSGTTVREIATDAGVNVALINRYFNSKEGLFEQCIARAGEDLRRTESGSVTIEQLLETIIRKLPEFSSDEYSLQLMLLLRSSGDQRADDIRRGILQSFAKGMATAAGWSEDDADSDRVMLRAQLVLAAAMGIVVLRSSTGVEPLTSASDEDLSPAFGELLHALLSP
jgi:AcrR family transcriptional regulator